MGLPWVLAPLTLVGAKCGSQSPGLLQLNALTPSGSSKETHWAGPNRRVNLGVCGQATGPEVAHGRHDHFSAVLTSQDH